jgi:hypothetical protein
VSILSDGTQELTIDVTKRLQEKLGITTASFAPARAVAGGGGAKVSTRVAPIVEKKMALKLLLVFLLFLHLYCNHNRNT